MMAGWTEVPTDSDHSEDEASSQVAQATKSLHKDQGVNQMPLMGNPKMGEVAKVGGLEMTIEQMRSFVVEMEKYLKGLSAW